MVVRSVGELPGGVVDAVRGVPGVVGVAPVRAGAALLTGSRTADGTPVDAPAPGWGIPVEVIAVDPAEYAAVLPEAERPAVAALTPGGVLLGATSARVRGLAPGAVLEVRGAALTVAGWADSQIAGATVPLLGEAAATARSSARWRTRWASWRPRASATSSTSSTTPAASARASSAPAPGRRATPGASRSTSTPPATPSAPRRHRTRASWR